MLVNYFLHEFTIFFEYIPLNEEIQANPFRPLFIRVNKGLFLFLKKLRDFRRLEQNKQ